MNYIAYIFGRRDNSNKYRQAKVVPTNQVVENNTEEDDGKRENKTITATFAIGGFSGKNNNNADDLNKNSTIERAAIPEVVSNRDESIKSSSINNYQAEVIVTPQLSDSKAYTPKLFDVWALGITTVIGGQFYGWNAGLSAGFGSYCIAQVLMGFAFVNLTFALAEIISTTSFSGGAYGMARVVLGFYAGFIIACFEFMEYITYISTSAVFLAEFVCESVGLSDSFTPLFCLIYYIVVSGFLIEEDRLYWRLNYLLAIVSLIIFLIYCIGNLGNVNFIEYASLEKHGSEEDNMSNWFSGGMVAFLRALPYTTWGFGGIECAALVTDMIDNPRKNLSYGMAYAVITLFACMILIMFVACSLPPGLSEFIKDEYFMNTGFGLLHIDSISAQWLIVPAQFAMAFGFFLPCCKLLHAIAQSKLLPTQLGIHGENHRKMAIVYTIVVSYVLCLVTIYVPYLDLTTIPILLASVTYLSDLYAYYKMRTDFNSRNDHQFVNPLGIFGAIYAAIIFMFNIVAILAVMDNHTPIYFLIIYWVLLTIYYFSYAQSRQVFSDDEQKSLLVLHVIQNNKWKRGNKQHKNRGQKGVGTPNNSISFSLRESMQNTMRSLLHSTRRFK